MFQAFKRNDRVRCLTIPDLGIGQVRTVDPRTARVLVIFPDANDEYHWLFTFELSLLMFAEDAAWLTHPDLIEIDAQLTELGATLRDLYLTEGP